METTGIGIYASDPSAEISGAVRRKRLRQKSRAAIGDQEPSSLLDLAQGRIGGYSAFLRRWVGRRWTISARLIARLHTFCRPRWTSARLRGTWPALLSRSLTGWICRR